MVTDDKPSLCSLTLPVGGVSGLSSGNPVKPFILHSWGGRGCYTLVL